jgi:predicted RNase H-like HicB family nuclease
MIDLPYNLVIEAAEEPDFFSFYSTDLQGFTGVGHSVEDCLYRARHGMAEFFGYMEEMGLPVPPRNPRPTVVIQNEEKAHAA